MGQSSRREVVRELRERLQHLEAANRWPEVFPTGIETLDRLLPRGGLPAGSLVEWLGSGTGAGAATLTMAVSGRILAQGGAVVVLDSEREFYPPAAVALGIPLERTVIVQPRTPLEGLWAAEQALRSGSAAVTVGWVKDLHDRAFRRLQLAAESGGGVGFLLRPGSARAEPSWALARLFVKTTRNRGSLPVPGRSFDWRLQVELVHCKGLSAGRVIEVDLSDETGDVQLVSRLADSAPRRRSAGA